MTKRILTLGIAACCLLHPRPGGAAPLIFDPSQPGPFEVLPFEYGPKFTTLPNLLRTDISEYFNAPDSEVIETMNNVPLRGVGHLPEGEGPFPLVLIVHGNWNKPKTPSHRGFSYLTELLASHGMIAISVDENFLNGSVENEIDARAIVLLRHLQVWRFWNGSDWHPFHKMVDLERVGLVGHSRGGEAITVANLFNKTRHDARDPSHDFGFGIKALFAIAPTDGLIASENETGYAGVPVVIDDANYFIMHGSRDGDLYYFPGQKTYDRAFPDDENAGGSKGLLFIHGANHNFWNEEWDGDDDDGDGGGDDSGTLRPAALIGPEAQREVAKIHVSGFFQWSLLGRKAYEALQTGDMQFAGLPEGSRLVHQYSHRERYDLDNYEEDELSTTGSHEGITNTDSLLHPFSDQDISGIWDEVACTLSNDLFLWHETRALVVGWSSTAATYTIDLPPGLGLRHPYLSLRIGQIYRNPSRVPNEAKDVSIQLQFGTELSQALSLSSFDGLLLYPVETIKKYGCPEYDVNVSKSLLKTVRIPLSSFAREATLKGLSQIHIRFAPSSSGLVVIDDIQLTE